MGFGERVRPRLPVVGLTDRRALEEWRPADGEIVARARRLKERALLDLGMSSSAVASWIYSKCHHQIPTTAVGTAAVLASGDGVCLLLYNPGFFVDIGLDGVRFVLFHEARHLVQRHLFADPELRDDPVFTVACEVTINHVALLRLKQGLPEIEGEAVGIDPAKVYRDYAADLRGQGLEPVPYATWIETDLTVYRELRRMREPPGAGAVCVHSVLEGEFDQETVDRIASDVLRSVLIAARRGNAAARGELVDLMGRTPESTRWGDLGAHVLRGTTVATRRVEWWQRWLVDVLGSKLAEGERLVYPKKRGALLAALGHEPMLSRRGPRRVKTLVIAIDTSGSMSEPVVTWLTELVGTIDGVEAHWLSFDGDVMPFRPGEHVRGGGGTDFGAVRDYVEGRGTVDGKLFDEHPDAIVMVTDGHAPPIVPAEPDRWIWLITPGGDDWPDRTMACHRIGYGVAS
ncbi:vWA domain-containing protein [Spirillospora sp. CA-294931]|uniref:vWA domain-containing protein n=1 Tax=Spirillospora sp. CA-294931 TaxID=3240042 RepID=UPI003D92F8BA